MKIIRKINALRKALKPNGYADFTILLNYGARSSKTIDQISESRFQVFNAIDGSTEIVTARQLETGKHFVGRAMKAGAFYLTSKGGI